MSRLVLCISPQCQTTAGCICQMYRPMKGLATPPEFTHLYPAPTPDPAVMRDYIDRLTRFYIDNPAWVALAEEARGYIGALDSKSQAVQATTK